MSLRSFARSPTRPIRASTGTGLSRRERELWAHDGFFTRDALFDNEELAALRGACQRVEARVSGWARRGRAYTIDGLHFRDVGDSTLQYEHDAPSRPRVVEPAHLHAPEFDALSVDPRLTAPARDLSGAERLSLFTDKLNWKNAGVGSAFRWHQDAPYWGHLPDVWERIDTLVNVLVYFDDADETNGCFRVVAGSHRVGVAPSAPSSDALAPLFVDPDALDLAAERALCLRAGSAVFFHPHLVHGSRPNTSPRSRRAMVLTYQAGIHPMFKTRGVRRAG